jgi:hypothetical protein
MIASLRQWFYPKEFRIKSSGFSLENFQMDEVIKKVEDLVKQILNMPTDQVDTKFVKEIATPIWRLGKRVKDLTGDSSSARVQRALNMIEDVLRKHEIEIRDYTGNPWKPPYSEMPWDDAQGVSGGIIRMVTPCVVFKGEFLQRGKIITEEGGQE